MYNLFVKFDETAWDNSPSSMEADRFLEHTEDHLKVRFENLNTNAIAELIRLPTIFAYEDQRDKPARVGRITDIRNRQGEIRVSFELDDTIPPLTPNLFTDRAWDFDINRLEMNRTHWAVKEVDLPAALLEIGVTVQVEAPRPRDTKFSRRTVISGASLLQSLGHTRFDSMLLELGVAGLNAGRDCGSLIARSNALAKFAVDNPSARTAEDALIGYAIVRRAIEVVPALSDADPDNIENRDQAAFLTALREDEFFASNRQLHRVIDTVRPVPSVRAEGGNQEPELAIAEAASVVQAVVPIPINPSLFRLPEGGVQENIIAVMMPFNAEFNGVIEAIQAACAAASLECMRVDDMWEDSTIIQDVFSLIYRARIVVVDLTGRNPNVFYETGIAHTLGKPVVPITQNKADVPFDLQHHRFVTYLNNSEGLQDLTVKLESRLRFLVQS